MDDSSKDQATQATEHETLRQELADLRKDFSTISRDLEKFTADEARAGVKKFGSEVELHPFISISTAFGVGLIIGRALGHR